MYIDFKVYENSEVEQMCDKVDVLQGESNVTSFRFALPEKIRGYNIANYKQEIKLESETGQLLRFYINNGEFALKREITAFKSVLVQLILTNTKDEDEPIIWRTIPFKYDFIKSINAIKSIGE